MKPLAALAVIAAGALGLAAIPVANAAKPHTAASPATNVSTRTVAKGAPGRLRPGARLIVARVYRSHRVTAVQWLRCNPGGKACHAIHGATRRTYIVRAADVGHTLRARVAATGSTVAVTAPTAQVGRPLPVDTALPTLADGGQGGGTLSGPIVGDVLTGTNGTWQHAVRFTYQWLDCDASGANCVPIAGATSQTYTLQDSDAGFTIVFQVTAYNFNTTQT